MKRAISICLFRAHTTTLVAMLALAMLLSAQAIVSAMVPSPLPTKWTQTPDMETGTDWTSMKGYTAADDYLCENPLPVNDVHWWGSYWDPYPGQPQPINGFTISFYSDVPASPTGESSHPGDLLHQAYINGNCNETYYGYSANDTTNVYQYGTILPEPFQQVPGTVYWLSIVVDQGWEEAPPYWGWHNSSDHWNDGAVHSYFQPPFWYPILGGGQDLAFELTVVPEPATICLLGIGALSLLRRKR
jgi:hypothetical protein